jgi:hypothetical protein
MDAATSLPDFGAMRRELEEARGAMCAAIEEARAKSEIVPIFIRANHISAEAAGAEVRFQKEKRFESQNAAREIALRVDCFRGQSLKDLEKAGRRFMGRPGDGIKIGTPPDPHLIVLDDLGLGGNAGRRESQDLQLLADMSPEAFEALVADPTAPRPRSGPEKCLLSLSEIRADKRAQPRAALDEDQVSEYVEAMVRGEKFPRLVLFQDKKGRYWVADGFHRFQAAVELKRKAIECTVYLGELRDAILYSCGANATHGLPRTNADKHQAATRLLKDKVWSRWSNVEISKRCRVSAEFVRKLRQQLEPVTSNIGSENERGTTATMSTGNIGRSRAPNPASGKRSPEQGPVPDSAAKLVSQEPVSSDDGRDLAPEPTAPDQPAPALDLVDAATDRATPDDIHVLDADLPTNFEATREQKISLDEKLGNLIFLVESRINAFVPDMRTTGRLPELFRRVRKLIDKLEAEAAADGNQTSPAAERKVVNDERRWNG